MSENNGKNNLSFDPFSNDPFAKKENFINGNNIIFPIGHFPSFTDPVPIIYEVQGQDKDNSNEDVNPNATAEGNENQISEGNQQSSSSEGQQHISESLIEEAGQIEVTKPQESVNSSETKQLTEGGEHQEKVEVRRKLQENNNGHTSTVGEGCSETQQHLSASSSENQQVEHLLIGPKEFDGTFAMNNAIQYPFDNAGSSQGPNPIDYDRVSIEEIAAIQSMQDLGYQDRQEDLDIASEEVARETEINNKEIGEFVGKRKPPMRIKEIKCGVTVIANIGNYENIRTHLEATAEIEQESDLMDAMISLNDQLKKLSRREYLEIKTRTIESRKKIGDRLNPH